MSSKCMRSILSLVSCLLGLCLCGAAPAAAECPNEALRYGYGAYLPDCRAYEQASPVDKGGSDVRGGQKIVQTAPDGSAVTFYDPLGLPGIPGSTAQQPIYVASRGSTGWSTVDLMPPASASWGGTFPSAVTYFGWSPDLTSVLAFGFSVPPSGQPTVMLSDPVTGVSEAIGSGTGEGQPSLDGFSANDLSVVFEDKRQLLPGAGAGEKNVYEWDRASGQLYLVDVLPDESVPASGAFAGSYGIDDANTSIGGAEDDQFNARSAVSSEATRVYFTAQADSGRDAGVDQVFVREDPASRAGTTVMVSASRRTTPDPSGPQPAAFWTASSDGSRVFFTSPEELTNNATTGSADQGNDLYEYDLATGVLTDLTPDHSDPDGAEVQGVVGASSDGSYVYFVANGVLAPEATAGTCKGESRKIAESGVCNLYVWHEGVITFIAQLNAGNTQESRGDWQDWNSGENSSASSHEENTARVAPDGQTLLFQSAKQLTAYDNEGYNELYRYSAPTASAPTGQLLCVSCDPSGAAPVGRAALQPPSEAFGVLVSEGTLPPLLSRNLSVDGDRVFFQSPDQLTATATGGVQNVYEWEADGSGGCQSTSEDGGCLFLISTGRSSEPSYFADASESGDDVFFFTGQQLVGQDKDELMDIYDARVDGGLASQDPVVESPCSGEACHGEAPPAASFATPTSASFSGAGNLTPSPVPVAAKGTTKPLTRAQKLAKVLRVCRKKPKRRRAECERQAHTRYGASRSRTVKQKGAHR
jgi:hypothetical protein